MEFNIVKAGQPFNINKIVMLIYGDPGAGKTSLANSSHNPLTLDFDNGGYRSENRKDMFVVESWEQIVYNIDSFYKTLSNYSTLVIDTVDTLLDYMGVYIVKTDPKLARNKLQYYGKLKEEFSLFINKLRTMNLDIIMIAHVKEKDEGEIRIKRPSITGASFDRVLQVSDFIGYLFMNNNQRTLDFNPNDSFIGKNSAKLPQMIIPSYADNPIFMSDIIKTIKESLNVQIAKQDNNINMLNDLQSDLELVENVNDLNNIFRPYLSKDLTNAMKKQIFNKVKVKADELGYSYNNSKKEFFSVN